MSTAAYCCCWQFGDVLLVSRHRTFIMTWLWITMCTKQEKKIYLCEHLQRMAQDAYKHISNSIFALLRLVELCSYIALFSSACPRFAIFLPYCVRIVWKHLQTEFISLPLNRMYDIKRGIHVEISSFSILNCIKMSLMQLFCLSTTVEATGEIVHTNANAISMPTANSQRFDRMCTSHDEKS